jgi:hypothetical protein
MWLFLGFARVVIGPEVIQRRQESGGCWSLIVEMGDDVALDAAIVVAAAAGDTAAA